MKRLIDWWQRTPRESERGQILVIVGVALVALLGFAALVTDIGIIYAAQRNDRNLTDTAALAGAQQLQQAGSRTVTPAERAEARAEALDLLLEEIGYTGPVPCATNADFTGCAIPGTDYTVAMQAPSPLCVTCDTERSLLVAVTQENIPATFARLFGRDGWTVHQASVAGLNFEGKYAVITLRGPKPLNTGLDQNEDNIKVDGGSVLDVPRGDIGSNTNLEKDNSSTVSLASGYKVHHYDDYASWSGPPEGKQIFSLIADPGYTIPTPAGSTYANLAGAKESLVTCAARQASVPVSYTVLTSPGVDTPVKALPATKVTCLKPGIYSFEPSNNAVDDVMLLSPGVYFFNNGLDIGGNLIGGWQAGSQGVALVFNECDTGAPCAFKGNNAGMIALNAGTCFPLGAGCPGAEATAAIHLGAPVQTSGVNPSELALTLIVQKDPVCVVAPVEPSNTCSTQNNTINIAGGGKLYLAGVQYAATDNVQISGGSSGAGYVGQIIAWTVHYAGGTEIGQFYPGADGNGILRLDEACSGAGAQSMSNASCTP